MLLWRHVVEDRLSHQVRGTRFYADACTATQDSDLLLLGGTLYLNQAVVRALQRAGGCQVTMGIGVLCNLVLGDWLLAIIVTGGDKLDGVWQQEIFSK